MALLTKHNATGRSTGKLAGKDKEIFGAPKDQPWVWLSRDLVNSDAWRLRSRNCAKFIDFLMADQMANAGRENGALIATYDQLEEWGLRRRSIRSAIEEAVFLGLVRITEPGGRWNFTNKPSLYRLTWLADRDGRYATNDWKKPTEARITARHEDRVRRRRAYKERMSIRKKQFDRGASATTVGALAPLSNCNTRRALPEK